jgi:hypothetical protein
MLPQRKGFSHPAVQIVRDIRRRGTLLHLELCSNQDATGPVFPFPEEARAGLMPGGINPSC